MWLWHLLIPFNAFSTSFRLLFHCTELAPQDTTKNKCDKNASGFLNNENIKRMFQLTTNSFPRSF